MAISRKLTRQIRRHLKENDARALIDALSSGGKLSDWQALAQAFEASYAETRAREKRLHNDLNVSSDEFLRQLGVMHTILESLGQGVAYFDSAGICSWVFSKACVTLLEGVPGGRHIGDVLGLDADGKKRMQDLVEVVFDGRSTIFPFEELMRYAPREYVHSQGLAVAISYRPMYDAQGRLASVLLIAEDISRDVAAREDIRLKEARIARMLRIAKDKMAFVGFLRKIESTLLSSGKKRSVEDFSRDVHTLKGMSRFFHLDVFATMLHEMENEMKVREKVTVEEMLSLCRDVVAELFEEAKSYGHEIWGSNFEIQEDVVTLPVSYATDFGRDLRAQGAQGIAFRYFQQIVARPVRDLLIPFETQLTFFATLAEADITVTMPASGEIRVFSPVYKDFFDSLVHVARNIVDHAGEPAEQREAAGKTPALNVWVDVAYGPFKHTMVLTIADDGAGIDAAKLREKLGNAAEGLSDEQVLQHVFDPKVSTRDTVSEESGRGIGLNAVKDVTTKLSGTVDVESQPGKGTVLTIRLPIIWEPN